MNDINRNQKKSRILEITYDQLLTLSDHDLKKYFINTRSLINKKRRNKQSTKKLEIDLCYIQQEIQNRRS